MKKIPEEYERDWILNIIHQWWHNLADTCHYCSQTWNYAPCPTYCFVLVKKNYMKLINYLLMSPTLVNFDDCHFYFFLSTLMKQLRQSLYLMTRLSWYKKILLLKHFLLQYFLENILFTSVFIYLQHSMECVHNQFTESVADLSF